MVPMGRATARRLHSYRHLRGLRQEPEQAFDRVVRS